MSSTLPIRSVAVLGAGTMGAQIAAHFANAGVPALLLDLTADVARDGLKRARALKPDPFFTADNAALVTVGGFDHDLERVAGVDWIIEAVVERVDVKRSLLERVDAARRPGTIVTSNTSGIPIALLRRGAATISGAIGSGRISSTLPAISTCSRSFRLPRRIARSSSACRRLPTIASAKAWWSQRTLPTSSPTTSACTV